MTLKDDCTCKTSSCDDCNKKAYEALKAKLMAATTSDAVEETISKNPPSNQLGFQLEAAKPVTDPRLQTLPTPQIDPLAESSNTVQGAPSIVEMARALAGNATGATAVGQIFEFVYDNIEWEPGWGVQKGALGCLMDGMGNAFDQSLLLANLLRQAGFTSNIVLGAIRLLDTQYEAWFGTSDVWGAQNYCFNEFIPVVTAPTWNGTQYYMDISHVWVQVVISGTTYVLDSSYKTYSRETGMTSTALASALGYTQSAFLSDVESGATIDPSGNFVQNMNIANLNSDLKTFTSNLISYINSNTIGSSTPGTATVDDILGGQTIVPVTLPLTLVTSLPYEMPGDTETVWTGDVPSTYKPTIQVQFPDWYNPGTWDFTYQTTSDTLAATRLTLVYNSSLVPSLYLNGTSVETGLAQPSGTYTSLFMTVTHPAYAAANYPLSSQQYYQTTWTWWQPSIYAGSGYTYLIANAWGNLGRGQADYHATQLAAAKASSVTNEQLLGEALSLLWFKWASQNSRQRDLANRLTNCHSMFSHQIGIVSGIGGSQLGTNIGGVSGSSTNLDNDTSITPINDTMVAMHGVALEAATLGQITGKPPAASSTTVIDRANRTAIASVGGTVTVGDVLTLTVHDAALSGGTKSDSYTALTGDTLTTIATGLAAAINGDSSLASIGVTAISVGAAVYLSSTSVNQTSYTSSTSGGATETITIAFQKIYLATSSNWSSGINVQSILVGNGYNSTDMTNVYNSYIQYGDTVVIPDHPNQTLVSWTGWGYWAYPAAGAYGIINGAFKGGMTNCSFCFTGPVVFCCASSGDDGGGNPIFSGINNQGPTGGDPISLFNGDFSYNHNDLTIGSQNLAYGLAFARSYNSRNQYVNLSGLGRGWTHNYAMTAAVGNDGLLGMGDQFAIQGAATIAELYVAWDLLSDSTRPIAKVVTTSLADKWWVDQIVNNTVVLTLSNGTVVFVKQPDGSYTAPGDFPSTLTLSAGLYTLTSPQGIKWNFNSSGQISTIVYPYGVTTTFSYTSGVLSTITNGMGRTLTLNYTGANITSVSDGNGRSVAYNIDSNNDLTIFTDANSNQTTYQYDQPGRLTQIFKPANPSTAWVTNVYDSLSRVKTQSNARGQQWTYYFAGSRSEEVDPLSNTLVMYFNPYGSVVRAINALGYETDSVYDGLNRCTQRTLAEGNQIQSTYDANNNLLTRTWVPKPTSGLSNIVIYYTYDPTWAKIASVKNGNGDTTTFSYNATTGTLNTIERPVIGSLTPTVSFAYNGRGQVTSLTDETGIVTQFNYSGSNETLTSMVFDYNAGGGHLNLAVNFGYDAVGNINSITDPNNNQTTIQSDNERRMTQRTTPSPFSFVAKFVYDLNGNLCTAQRQTGNATNPWETYSLAYSVTDKPVLFTEPSGASSSKTYDGKDRLQSTTDPMSRVYQYSYDALNRIYQITDPTSTISQSRTYTPNGYIASAEDANLNTTQYLYDGLDRPNKAVYPDSTFDQCETYDANNNVLTILTRSGSSIINTFDVLNRLSTKSPAGEATVTYEYDLAGRLLSATTPVVAGEPSTGEFQFAYDTAGRFYQEQYPDGKQVTLQLDNNGNITEVTYPDGYYITRNVDALNRLSSIYLNGSSTAAATLSYDELSRRTALNFVNGAGIVYGYASPTVSDLTSVNFNFSGSNVVFTYSYNANHELTSESSSVASYNWHPPASATVTYGGANNLNQYPIVAGVSYSYNSNGCLTGNGLSTFGYDTENHLASASMTGVSVAYVYDPLHRQAQKAVTTSGTVKTRYVYSKWQRIADYDGASGSLQNRYVYGSRLDEPIIQITAGGTVTFYHPNYQNSITAISDNTGAVLSTNVFGPFGETSSLAGSFGYTSQRYDSEIGLYYYKARYYSPGIGRFLQPDPVAAIGDHLYQYCFNSPLNYVDPYGLQLQNNSFGSGTSPTEAAAIAAAAAQSQVISNAWNQEVGGVIWQNPDGTFGWSIQVIGGEDSVAWVNLSPQAIASGDVQLYSFHDHGASIAGTWGINVPSITDITNAIKQGGDGLVITPSGTVYEISLNEFGQPTAYTIDPQTGALTEYDGPFTNNNGQPVDINGDPFNGPIQNC